MGPCFSHTLGLAKMAGSSTFPVETQSWQTFDGSPSDPLANSTAGRSDPQFEQTAIKTEYLKRVTIASSLRHDGRLDCHRAELVSCVR
jgi:hypothetical protein